MLKSLTIRNQIKIPLGILIALLALFTFLRVQDYRESRAQLESLARSTAQTLEAVRIVETVSSEVRSLAMEVSADGDNAATDALSGLGRTIVAEARDSLSSLQIGPDLKQQIGAALDEMSRRLTALALSLETYRAADNAMAEARLRLSERIDQLELANASIMAGALVSARTRAVTADAENSLDLVLSEVEPALRYRVGMSELLALLRELAAVSDTSRIALLSDESTDKMSVAVLSLSRLPPETSRTVTPPLRALRESLSGPDGFIARASDLQRAEAALDRQLVRLGNAAESDFLGLADVTRATGSGNSAILGRQQDAAFSSARLEILLSSVVGLGVVVAVWMLFAKVVGRRIEYLTDDMLAIAHGDLGREPSVNGTDEIGRMGDALEVFRQNAQELKRSNEDLENFAYVASHDLRSPLWAIRDLAEWTIEDHGDELSRPVRDNLDLILARVQRLAQLLADLLDYARAGEVSRKRIELDLSEMTAEIDDLLGANGFDIVFSGEPRLFAAPAPIRTILLNLVSNAIKHHDRETGRISVENHIREGAAVIDVADDGPGIDPRYQTKIFDLFQTLELKDKHESSGLGLAMARKLAEQLGGSLTVHSNPQVRRGTTFTLIIPVAAMKGADASGGAPVSDGEAA